jgi:MFS family permease
MNRYRAFMTAVLAGVLTAVLTEILDLPDLGAYALTFGVGAIVLGAQARQEVTRQLDRPRQKSPGNEGDVRSIALMPETRIETAPLKALTLRHERRGSMSASRRHRHAWALSAMFIGVFTSSFVGFTTTPLISPIHHDLGMSISGIEMLTAAYVLPLLLLPLLENRIGGHLPSRITFLGGGILACAACATAAVGDSSLLLTLSRAAQGLSAVLILSGSLQVVRITVADEARRRAAFGLILSAGPVGLLLAAASTGAMAQLFGWRGVFWLAAVLMALAFFLGQYGIGRFGDGSAVSGADWLGLVVVGVAGPALVVAAYRVQTRGFDLLSGGLLILAGFALTQLFVADARRGYNLGLAQVFRRQRLRLILIGILGRSIQLGAIFFAAVYLALVAGLSEVLVSISFVGFAATVLLPYWWLDLASRIGIRLGLIIPAVFSLLGCGILVWSIAHANTVGPAVGLVCLGFGTGSERPVLDRGLLSNSGVQPLRDLNASSFVIELGALAMFLIVGGVICRGLDMMGGQSLGREQNYLAAAFVSLASLAVVALVLTLTVPSNGLRPAARDSFSEVTTSHF